MKKSITFLSYLGVMGAGCLVGVLSTKAHFRKMYKDIADAEIESVKEVFGRKVPKNDIGDDFEDQSIFEYSSVVPDTVNYNTFSDDIKAETEHPKDDADKPYQIDIDDFDQMIRGYGKKELQYYMEDGTLVDEEENILSIADIVGCSLMEEFENSVQSCLYVRNEKLAEDYEISKVFAAYGDVIGEDDL